MIKSIITNRDRLTVPCDQTHPNDVDSFLLDLVDTAQHFAAKPVGCLGLAAPQIGINARMFVMFHEGRFMAIINPEIKKRTGAINYKGEMCLSRPDVVVRKGRRKKIRVKYTDEAGDVVERNFSNLNARIFQHEFDHLNGILI